MKDIIAAFLEENEGKGYTVTDLLKTIPELDGDSNQHVSAILRQMFLANTIERYTEKRRTYFKAKAGD